MKPTRDEPPDPSTPSPGAEPRSRPKVIIDHVSVIFEAERKTVHAVEDVNLTIADGEFVCLLGPSGCGKSTLLNVIGGFLQPTSGVVRIEGEPVERPDPRRIFVFQERGVLPWLTVEGNIGFGLHGVPPADRAQRVRHYVELVGLKGFERAYPQELSGGMKQRVEVARALAVNPDVLYLDEPFGALDSITRLQIRTELLRIWSHEKQTVLFVTHDIEESLQLADRVVVMSARPGRVQRVVRIDIPRPRDISSREYIELRDEIFAEIGLVHRI